MENEFGSVQWNERARWILTRQIFSDFHVARQIFQISTLRVRHPRGASPKSMWRVTIPVIFIYSILQVGKWMALLFSATCNGPGRLKFI